MLQRERGIAATLIPGKGGEFEITVNDKLVFSKRQEGRFPDNEEVLAHITV